MPLSHASAKRLAKARIMPSPPPRCRRPRTRHQAATPDKNVLQIMGPTLDQAGREIPAPAFMFPLFREAECEWILCDDIAQEASVNLEASCHGRRCLSSDRGSVSRPDGPLRRCLRPIVRRIAMTEPIIGLIVGISLGVYLLYTLIRPEKF
jgi:K+-transporting ATPase KdpF subunit